VTTLVQLGIYDLLGREITRLAHTRMNRGFHTVGWDGKTSNGVEVPTGTYIARLITPGYAESIKMLLLK